LERKKENENIHCKENIWKMIEKLDSIVDESDPDTELPQIVHAYQTSEMIIKSCFENADIKGKFKEIEIRSIFPDVEWADLPENIKKLYEVQKTIGNLYGNIEMDWFPLVGLIHDLGKVVMLPEFGKLPQWAAVGDTFPVGCKLNPNYVYEEKGFFNNNPDSKNSKFNSKLGSYTEACGFDNVHMSWGHDEYLSMTLTKKNQSTIPPEGIYLIRYHSFYSWHTLKSATQKRGYTYFANEKDWKMLPLVKLFQGCDLYSKTKDSPPIQHIKDKYAPLIDKYLPSIINW